MAGGGGFMENLGLNININKTASGLEKVVRWLITFVTRALAKLYWYIATPSCILWVRTH